MPRTDSASRVDLHLPPRETRQLDALQAAREDPTKTDTLRALIREEHRREAARQTRRTARATDRAPAGGGEENPPR